jgi:hypothetical protein
MCKFQTQIAFTREGILENNINYILKLHLINSLDY